MKKKLIIFFTSIVCIIAAIAVFPACDNCSSDLQCNKKYISESAVNDNGTECYYEFYSDMTGIYRYYEIFDYLDGVTYYDYTITFKYTYADKEKSAVVCFFDSVKYGRKNTYDIDADWSRLLTVSKNVLAAASSYGYHFYINEDYIKDIPNFNS